MSSPVSAYMTESLDGKDVQEVYGPIMEVLGNSTQRHDVKCAAMLAAYLTLCGFPPELLAKAARVMSEAGTHALLMTFGEGTKQ